ncbi:MAG: hypothetical protein ACYDBB_07795 [Armatimonadota bacterium]
MRYIVTAVLLLALTGLLLMKASAYELPISLQEHLGHAWGMDAVHRSVEVPQAGKLFPNRVALYRGKHAVPMQLANVEKYKDGSIRKADIWFRSGLAANETRTLTLSTRRGSTAPGDLRLKKLGNVYELSNAITAVRVPAGSWKPATEMPAGEVADTLAKYLGLPATGQLPGPLLGVKLASGKWTAMAHLKANTKLPYEDLPGLIQPIDRDLPTGAFQGYTTEIVAQGPVFITLRTTYRFANEGSYVLEVTLRTQEKLVRIDERYDKAGTLSVEMTGFRPDSVAYECNAPSPNGKTITLDYAKPAEVGLFVGWSFFFKNVANLFLFTGDPSGDELGLVSTDADWLPFPYNQGLHMATDAQAGVTLTGHLDSGRRHWGVYVGKKGEFANPAKDFAKWWMHHTVVTFDKVMNWQLAWPKMEEIEFPHTFFSKADLPGIQTRLQADPTISQYIASHQVQTLPDPKTNNYGYMVAKRNATTAYLYSGDPKYLAMLKESPSPGQYLDHVIDVHLNQAGYYSEGYLNFMQLTDELLVNSVNYELELGSGLLTPREKKAMLSKLAFVVYLMHDQTWWPPNYPFEPTKSDPYPAYVQGTPNQKHCYYSVRAMTACMLANHPQLPKWIAWALEENERVMPGSVAENGVYVESAFYSARDTMRFGPFWTALTRAGAKGPEVEKWIQREKLTFQYLGDLLTPPEPRFGGRRVYHPLGRSCAGVVDPTFMIGADPFAQGDEEHARRMRWIWEAQGKPSPDIVGETGGRNIALTLLSFSRISNIKPSDTPPLVDKRWQGFGAIFRSQVGSDYESNVVFRHGPFSWDMYEGNNGGVYFYGKGAPLLPRFGAYWNGAPNLMSIPFGNRLQFPGMKFPEWTDAVGDITTYASLGNQAGYAIGNTREALWKRSLLFAKDLDRNDPVYLLVRDDIDRPGTPTALHWWVMSKTVQPDGVEKPGVVPAKGYTDEQWIANLGKNWKNAPKLTGQSQHFTGQCGVDVDMYIATPAEPLLTTDAVGAGPNLAYAVNAKLYEYQQLVRIEQPSGKPYLTLLVPRLPGSPAPAYRTIADGAGVAVTRQDGEDRLFVADKAITYADDLVNFTGQAGYVRKGGTAPLRLMVAGGRISAMGITLVATEPAALLYDGKMITVYCAKDAAGIDVQVIPSLQGMKVVYVHLQ